MKKYATAGIVILALVIGSATVYGLFNLNSIIMGKSDQSTPNYTSALNSLKPQISSLSNNVSSLNSIKADVSDIKGKLSDLETKINQAQQSASQSSRPIIILDRSVYLQGDTILIIAVGFDPQKVAQIQLRDNNGYVVTQAQTSSDSAGRLTYNLALSSSIIPGNYQVKIISGQLAAWQQITIMERSYSGSVILSGPYLFNAQTDQDVYLSSDVIEVFGTGKPYTSVYGVLTSPSGMKFTSNTTIQPGGTFAMFFSGSQPFESGSWYVTVNNQGVTRTLYLSVQSGNSSNVNPFTAQSDFGIYQTGDQIRMSGIAQPYTTVSASLTSPSGHMYMVTTTASFDGSYQLFFSTSQLYETGYWNVNLTNQGQSRGFSIYMTSTSSPHSFTAQTDKTIYKKGDQIQISGTGKSYTAVKATLRSPSGTTYNTAVTAHLDGSYVISFPTSSSFETGNWYIEITNSAISKVVSIFLEP